RRRTRTAARRGRREPRRDSARRRRSPGLSPRGRHLALDTRGVLLVRLRVRGELDDLLLTVERVLAPHVDVGSVDLDEVVAGTPVAPQTRGRDRAGVDDEETLELPRVGNMLVPAQHQVDARVLQRLERVAGVVYDVALTSG